MARREWPRAEAALRKAVALDPGNALAHHWLANILLVGYGRRDEALREQVIAARLDPLSPVPTGTLGWHRYLRGELAVSRAEYERAVDLDTDFDEGHAGVIRAAARLGDEAGAEAALAAGLARRDDLRGELLAEGASALAVLGDRQRARERVEDAERLGALPITLATGLGRHRGRGARLRLARAGVVPDVLVAARGLVGSETRRGQGGCSVRRRGAAGEGGVAAGVGLAGGFVRGVRLRGRHRSLRSEPGKLRRSPRLRSLTRPLRHTPLTNPLDHR